MAERRVGWEAGHLFTELKLAEAMNTVAADK